MTDASPGGAVDPGGVDAVLFDFGGVFIDSPFAHLEAAAETAGIPAATLSLAVFGPYEQDTEHPWHRLERGELSFDACRSEIAAAGEASGLGAIDPIQVLIGMSSVGSSTRGFAVEAVRDLRAAGLRTGVVTNNIAEFSVHWRAMIPVDELFDDVVDSCEVGVRKPDPAIYELACRRIGSDPSRTIFVDDHAGNVAGARRAGLIGICCGYSVETTRVAIDEILERVGLG